MRNKGDSVKFCFETYNAEFRRVIPRITVKCFPHKAIAVGDLTNKSKGELESRGSSG
ncbi:MAG TPA: hypothetical protein VEP90_16100 [Methylomirabilota bacterium]|nr:hypothetical protein [Methylomirabilota bacterium]